MIVRMWHEEKGWVRVSPACDHNFWLGGSWYVWTDGEGEVFQLGVDLFTNKVHYERVLSDDDPIEIPNGPWQKMQFSPAVTCDED